jgi:hypothetical protein
LKKNLLFKRSEFSNSLVNKILEKVKISEKNNLPLRRFDKLSISGTLTSANGNADHHEPDKNNPDTCLITYFSCISWTNDMVWCPDPVGPVIIPFCRSRNPVRRNAPERGGSRSKAYLLFPAYL